MLVMVGLCFFCFMAASRYSSGTGSVKLILSIEAVTIQEINKGGAFYTVSMPFNICSQEKKNFF